MSSPDHIQMAEISASVGDNREEIVLARTNSFMSQQSSEESWHGDMAETTTDVEDNYEEVFTTSVQDDMASNKLVGNGLPLSSDLPPDPKSLNNLCEQTSLVRSTLKQAGPVPFIVPPPTGRLLDVILGTVEAGVRMDTDSLKFAVNKMAVEKPNDGDLCRKQYISVDFARSVIANVSNDSNLEGFADNAFLHLHESLNGSKIEVLCVPVFHEKEEHWSLYAFNTKEWKLSILDSATNTSLHGGIPLKIYSALQRNNKKYEIRNNKKYEIKIYEDMSGSKPFTLEFADVPKQDNSFDCGFFVFTFMRQWDGYKLTKPFTFKTEEMRKKFKAYCMNEASAESTSPNEPTESAESASPNERGPNEPTGSAESASPNEPTKSAVSASPNRLIKSAVPASPNQPIKIPPSRPAYQTAPESTLGGTSDSTRAPLYKVSPVTKIIVEPCKALKSPFLVKRPSFRRPDAKIMEYLYHYTTTNTFPNWPWMGNIQKLMKDKKGMNNECLNLAICGMERKDAHDFRNTMCLGWRHYVDSDWAVQSFSGYSNPEDLKSIFYRRSALYNASQSHLVFIPVVVHCDQNRYWSLYVFDMSDQNLSILDSRPDGTKGYDDALVRHEKIRCNLCDALTKTMDFAIDFRSWKYKFPKVPRDQNRYDSGFFVFNFMRLWDGHQLVRWFPTESRELRKDFLAYVFSCKDSIDLPDEISSRIKDLPGEMMDSKLQKVARESSHKYEFVINIGPAQEAPDESPIPLLKAYRRPSRNTQATRSAPNTSSSSTDILSTSTCHRVTSDGDGLFHIAARFGNIELVNDIWKSDETIAAVLLSAANNRGDTPLHCAAARGDDCMVQRFLVLMSSEGFAEFRTAQNLKVVTWRAQNLKGQTCLHEAVRHGHAQVVKRLIEWDKYNGNTSENLSSLRLPHILDNEGISPLYLATTLRRTEIVLALTSWWTHDDVPASCAGPAGKTALHAAVILLDEELIKTLLQWNASLTSQGDESGSTPLHFLASLPLEYKVLPLILPSFPLEEFPIILPLLKLLDITLFSRPYFVRFWGKLFCNPARRFDIAEFIIEQDPLSVLYSDSTGSFPIHIAAAHGRLDTIKKLLEECPYCESSRNAFGQTFLHVAVEKEKLKIVRFVCGAEKLNRILNEEDQDGNTALHLSVKKGNEKIFCTLMQNREVSLNFANKEGRTPLDLAFLSLHPKVICMKGPREWIFFDLLHGGGEFGVCSWDSLVGNIVEPEWEKESERVGKSASMLAVCAVLILNAALLASYNVVSHKGKDTMDFNAVVFQAFVALDSAAFVCSAGAIFFYSRAGFAMLDDWIRLENLITGTYFLGIAALTLICAVALALWLLLPVHTNVVPIILLVCYICYYYMALDFANSWTGSTGAHLRAIRARTGISILQLGRILLFQHSTVEPIWVVPSAPTGLLVGLLACAYVCVYLGIVFAIQKFAGLF